MKARSDSLQPLGGTKEVPGTTCRPDRLGQLASRLARTLGLARALAQNGRALDLTGIDDGIGMLCAQTLDLEQPEARQMLPLLHEVLGQVNALDAAMRGNVEEAPSSAGLAARAHKAYRQ